MILFWALSFALAAPITGKDVVSGRAVESKSSAKATALIFVSTKCPCSIAHESQIKELHQRFSPQGIDFIAVHSNADEKAADAQQHFQKTAFPFPVIKDQDSTLANRFGALRTPHAFLLSPNGEVLYAGGVDSCATGASCKHNYLADALGAVLQGKRPSPDRTRPVGCVIERP